MDITVRVKNRTEFKELNFKLKNTFDMKNKDSETTTLRYVFYILLTCVLCVGCNNETELNTKNRNTMKTNRNAMGTNGNNIALGYTEEPLKSVSSGNGIMIGYTPRQEIKLEPHQLAFIEKCKKDGKLGCSLIINNQQVYVSFYNIEPSVGNAR